MLNKMKSLILVFSFLFLAGCGSQVSNHQREVLGNPEAPLSFQVYSDIECPACAKASVFLDLLVEKYGDQIKITYHHFPLEQIHQYAFGAAVAAECAGQQGQFWKYVKYIYQFQDQLDTKNLKKHALNLALNTESFNQCIDTQATANIVKSDLKEALALKLEGTPTFSINGEKLPFGATPEEVIQKIDEFLAKTSN